uniref:Transmembrane protein 215 n=1 Tax=Lepisosteus oculatus TaxID=7918 RepID=W5NN20_LEPOC|nr:PREDICTED: transmembrane protein 215 [Lepisosteus oculatus]
MRPDDINPRTGLVVALCSVFLVFGFMFTVSGVKGETLGDVPLIAIGPAICLPGVAAIILAKKTNGCTRCPGRCRRKRQKETSQLLRSPWHLGSGKGSCGELGRLHKDRAPRSGEDSVSSTTTVGEARSLIRQVDQDEVMRYLQACYPSTVFMGVRDVSSYCVFDHKRALRESAAYSTAHSSVMYLPRDSIVVYSRRDSSPYGAYCCYINPGDFRWGQETVV